MKRHHLESKTSDDHGQSSVVSIDDLLLEILVGSLNNNENLLRALRRRPIHFEQQLESESETSDDHGQSSSSAQTVASIDDLLLQIFVRLRSKPLVRFKSVSKHWNNLITSITLSRNQQPNNPAVGLIYPTNPGALFFAYVVPFDKSGDPTFVEFPKPAVDQRFYVQITHSCNGLLLCERMDRKDYVRRYFVLNPTTKKCATLPDLATNKHILGMCLAFDPSKSTHYKVVCVLGQQQYRRRDQYEQFQVYSSQTGSWRCASSSMDSFVNSLEIGNGVYWNGALHWIPRCWDEDFPVYFNPEDHPNHPMPRGFPHPPMPSPYSSVHGYSDYFGESCGHLHFVGQAVSGDVTVFEMRTDYSEWFVKYRVRVHVKMMRYYNQWSPDYKRHFGSYSVCALVRGIKDEDSFLVLWNRERTIRYNIVSRTYETLHDLPYPCNEVPLPTFESICDV